MKRVWHSFYLLMIVVMVIWATTASLVTELTQRGITAEEIVVFDCCLSAVILLALTLAVPGSRQALRRSYSFKHLPWLFLCGLFGTFLYNALLYKSMQSDAHNVVPYVVINYMWPLTTLFFGVIILREKLTIQICVGALFGFLGFAFIQLAAMFDKQPQLVALLHDGSYGPFARGLLDSFGQATALGCFMAFGAAVVWGIFSAGARRVSDVFHFEPLSSMTFFAAAGAVVALVVFGPQCDFGKVLSQWDVVLMLIVLAAGAHGVANLLWLRAIKVGGAGRTAIVAYLTPVLALLILGMAQHQWPNWYSAIGLVIILGAVALAEFHRRNTPLA